MTIRLVLVLVAVLSLGCATAFRVGNTAYGGSFICGSVDTTDSANIIVAGCIEEALHGDEE